MTLKQAYKIIFNQDIENLTESKIRNIINKKELTRAYKKLISEFHPDLVKYKKGISIQTMETYSKEINEAYDILKSCLNPLYIHSGTYQETAFEKYLKDLEEKKNAYLRQQKERTQKLKEHAIERLKKAYSAFEYSINFEIFQKTTYLYNGYNNMPLLDLFNEVINYKKEIEVANRIKREKTKLYEKALYELESGNIDFDFLERVIDELTISCRRVYEDNVQYQKVVNWFSEEEEKKKKLKERQATVLDSVKISALKRLTLYKKTYISLRKDLIQTEILNALEEIANQSNNQEKLILSERYIAIIKIHSEAIKECERKFEEYYNKINRLNSNKINEETIKEIESFFEELCKEYLSRCEILANDPEKIKKLKNKLETRQPRVEDSLKTIKKTYEVLREKLINEIMAACDDIRKNQHNQKFDFTGIVEEGYTDLTRINQIIEIILVKRKILSIEELLKLRDEVFYLIYDQNLKKKSSFLTEEEKNEIQADEKYLKELEKNIKDKYEYFIMYHKYLQDKNVPDEIESIYKKYLNNSNNSNIVINSSKKLDKYYEKLERKIDFKPEEKEKLRTKLIESIDTYIIFYRGIKAESKREEYYNLTWYNSKKDLEGLSICELYEIFLRSERMFDDNLKNIPPTTYFKRPR